MNLIEPRWKLFDNFGREQTWDTLQAHGVLWHDRNEREYRERSTARRAARHVGAITLTDAGRDYLAALRTGQA